MRQEGEERRGEGGGGGTALSVKRYKTLVESINFCDPEAGPSDPNGSRVVRLAACLLRATV